MTDVRTILEALCIILVTNLLFVAPAVGKPLALEKDQLYLVFDPRLQGVGQNCELKVHQFKRHPLNPLIKPEKWNPGGWWECCTVLWDEDAQIFKMWYTGVQVGRAGWDRYVCYAISKDGIHWKKPSLGLYEAKGSKNNNICLTDVLEASVYRNPNATDPQKRYEMWAVDHLRFTYHYYSPDGIRWRRAAALAVIPAGDKQFTPKYPGEPDKQLVRINRDPKEGLGDRQFTYWFPGVQKFVCFQKAQSLSGPPWRTFVRFESRDGINWDLDNPTWVLKTDKEDEKFDPLLEFYGLGIHPVGDFYLMTPQLFHAAQGDHADVGLAYSVDTVRWYRAFRGQTIFPRGAEGEWDWGWIGQAPNIVEKDGMWWMYYFGFPYTHYDERRKKEDPRLTTSPWGIGLAQMPIGRIVSARSWRTEGSWTIGPVQLSGAKLQLNARIYEQLRLTILDEQEKPIPGFEVTIGPADSLELPVVFANGSDLSALSAQAVKIRFELKNAEVFGFKCE